MKSTAKIDRLLSEVVTLPSLPDIVARIDQMLGDPNCSLADVGQVISTDPAIAIKTLRLINSAYYGLGHKITAVEHAVTMLGTKVVRNMVLTAALFDGLFKGQAESFMEHSVLCGSAMTAIVKRCPGACAVKSPDEAFIYGLLHDVGKVVLRQFMAEEYTEVEAVALQGGKPWFRVERDILGADHAQVGARLAEQWKLAEALSETIAGHHDLGECDDDYATGAASLCVADYVAIRCGVPNEDKLCFDVDPAMWEATPVSTGDVPAIVDELCRGLPGLEDLLQLTAD